MNKICTTIEQSKKLIELGIDINTADMFWDTAEPLERIVPTVGPISDYYDMEDWAIPAWSLSALLDILPKGKVLIDDAHSNKYKVIGYNLDTDYYDEPLDACYEMILKLKENNNL